MVRLKPDPTYMVCGPLVFDYSAFVLYEKVCVTICLTDTGLPYTSTGSYTAFIVASIAA